MAAATLMVVALPLGAEAADPEPFAAVDSKPAAAAPSDPEPSLVVTEAQCRAAVAYQPSADVAYKPGVDVYGRPVKSAELGSGNPPLDLPEEFNIDIVIDIGDRLGQAQNPRPFESNLPIGKVTVKGDRFFFNGKEFGDSEQRRLERACWEFLKGKRAGG